MFAPLYPLHPLQHPLPMNATKSAIEEVLTFATQNGRAVLTLDRRDFIRLHRSRPDHAGIIVCTQDDDTAGQAERIHQAIASFESLAGQLLRVDRPARRFP